MIDTVDFFILRDEIDPITFREFLKRIKVMDFKWDGRESPIPSRGHLKNYRIAITTEKIFFTGSLSKFYFDGTNVFTLKKDEITEAIKKLKKETGLPIQKGIISRLHIADVVQLDFKMLHYFNHLGETPKFTRGFRPNEVKYHQFNNSFEIVFYDKIKEMRKNDPNMAKQLEENDFTNLMKIEVRVNKDTRAKLIPKARKLMMVHLMSGTFQNKLANLWMDSYKEIHKKQAYEIPKTIEDFKSLRNILASIGISMFDVNALCAEIDVIADKSGWDAPKRSKTKSKIIELYKIQYEETQSKYIKELNQKVKESTIAKEWLRNR
jgi:hypothetical protein